MSDEPAWSPTFLLLTCEHGGNEVPDGYGPLFAGADELLASHRGWDIGALGVALRMASLLTAPIVFSTTTRLLIELNRSLDQPDLFSELMRGLERAEKDRIIAAHYTPYHSRVESIVAGAAAEGRRVLHVSVHSCVDVLGGAVRELEASLLFDPARLGEASLCGRWRDELARRAPGLRFPFNTPYNGTDDGLTTALRKVFAAEVYAGVEVELRQGMIRDARRQRAAGDLLASSLAAAAPGVGAGPGVLAASAESVMLLTRGESQADERP